MAYNVKLTEDQKRELVYKFQTRTKNQTELSLEYNISVSTIWRLIKIYGEKEEITIIEGEIWRDIDGFENLYQISNMGRVLSLERSSVFKLGKHKKETEVKVPSKILVQSSVRGYLALGLCKYGKYKQFKIHRLVAQAFIPNIENKPGVNHKNGIKTDNRVENLEWVTDYENKKHAKKNGLNFTGKRKVFKPRVLNKEIVKNIREDFENGMNQTNISKKYSISRSHIGRVIRGVYNG